MVKHTPYWNNVLGALYCEADGEEWHPCLHVRQEAERQQAKPACRCSHSDAIHVNGGVGRCTSLACGCLRMRPRVQGAL